MRYNVLRGITAILIALLVLVASGGCHLARRTPDPLLASSPFAPIRILGSISEIGNHDWFGFRHPAEAEKRAGLYTSEPYQEDKIPVVFVHGLLSEPSTWNEMLNALRSDTLIRDHFQFWLFMYPTGTSYIKTASDLRRQLSQTYAQLKHTTDDSALDDMVLIGHSMGGLLCKLQATESGPMLWDAVSSRPFDEFRVDNGQRNELRNVFFFEPLPFVRRIIFVATPHRGSQWSTRPVGRLGTSLVRFPRQMRNDYQRMVKDNLPSLKTDPGSVIPTSVDHLSPTSELIQAVDELPFAPHVTRHSIIGVGARLPDGDPGDGVVSLVSARSTSVDSELLVNCKHTTVHRHSDSVREVSRILREHLAQSAARDLHSINSASGDSNLNE